MIQTQPADPERLTVTDRLPECIPVVLLTGYLGAGKTSLINALIADSELRDTAVVVNEFGEIAVDYDLIQIESRRLLVTSNGCLCCTVASDVRASLFELYEASRTGVAPTFHGSLWKRRSLQISDWLGLSPALMPCPVSTRWITRLSR
jgi:hypothetical protein